jgi:hypothetical protein
VSFGKISKQKRNLEIQIKTLVVSGPFLAS